MALIIVGVLVAFPVTHLPHQPGHRVPQVQGHRLVGVVTRILQRLIDPSIGRVALGGRRQVDRRLGQGDAALGHAQKMHCLLGRDGHSQGLRPGQANVLGSQHHQAAGNEQRVFTCTRCSKASTRLRAAWISGF